MTDPKPAAWRDEVARRLAEANGLRGDEGALHIAIDKNANARAAAIEDALDRAASAGQDQAEALRSGAGRLEGALEKTNAAAQKATDQLVEAIKELVDASNSNTTTMAGLQKWVIGLTVVYVVLTAVMAVATWLGPGH